jgi:ABC-2 type transport system permease protein
MPSPIKALMIATGGEFAKLSRTLALALVFAAPGLIAIFSLANQLRSKQPTEWMMWMSGAASIWAYFMLPMALAALSALMANMEHSVRMWDHLRALPTPRWVHYGAKAICLLAILAFMTAAVPAMVWGALSAGSVIDPRTTPSGVLDIAAVSQTSIRLFGASLLLATIQLWVALRFASFVPAIVVGIAGTFFAVVAPTAKIGIYSPWQIPLNAISEDLDRSSFALAFGTAAGAVLLVAAIAHLARRDVI